MSSLADCRLISLPQVTDHRGNLTVAEGGDMVPFAIARAYWLHDVPGGARRGGHAHRDCRHLIISASGSFDVVVDDGNHRTSFHLNRSNLGLYVPDMIWRELENFSSGSICLVLASEHFDEADYFRDYDEFVAARSRSGG